jgi:hypothetical protein
MKVRAVAGGSAKGLKRLCGRQMRAVCGQCGRFTQVIDFVLRAVRQFVRAQTPYYPYVLRGSLGVRRGHMAAGQAKSARLTKRTPAVGGAHHSLLGSGCALDGRSISSLA